MNIIMNQYRITKYDPKNRVNGIYTKDEWTSYSEIGREYNHKVFTEIEYLEVEQSYINSVKEIAEICNIDNLQIDGLERHGTKRWRNKQWISNQKLQLFIQECLREKCWARLNACDFFVHFGYAYYMYVGCKQPYNIVDEIAKKYNLFCEVFDSPHMPEEE